MRVARRAVHVFPNYVEGRRTLALAFDLQDRFEEAANTLLDILALDPPDSVKVALHKELGEYYKGPLKQPAKAVEHKNKALDMMEPDDPARQRLEEDVKALKTKIERQRLEREGKPVPPGLRPDAKHPKKSPVMNIPGMGGKTPMLRHRPKGTNR